MTVRLPDAVPVVAEIMDDLEKAAYTPEASESIVANALWLLTPPPGPPVTLFMTECGAGFHEFRVLAALQAAGVEVARIVMMDIYGTEERAATWAELAERHRVRLVVLDSYIALADWVEGPDAPTGRRSLVLYVNGCMRFGSNWCRDLAPGACQEAAVRFWRWCQREATHTPWNLVGHVAWRPGLNESWDQMASPDPSREFVDGRSAVSVHDRKRDVPAWWAVEAVPDTTMDDRAFDLVLRAREAQRTGSFAYSHETCGRCGPIVGAADRLPYDPDPAVRAYAEARGVRGVVAIVSPQIERSTLMVGRRSEGVPAFVIDRSDPGHWRWKPDTGPRGGHILGSSHQVVLRSGAPPSDPTIEQFDPAVEYTLYVVDKAQDVGAILTP